MALFVRRFVLLERKPQSLKLLLSIFRGLSALIEGDGTVAKVPHCKAEQFGSLRLRFLCILVRTPQFFTFDTSVQGHSCVCGVCVTVIYSGRQRLGRVAHVRPQGSCICASNGRSILP